MGSDSGLFVKQGMFHFPWNFYSI